MLLIFVVTIGNDCISLILEAVAEGGRGGLQVSD